MKVGGGRAILSRVILFSVLIAVLGGLIFLVTWNEGPAPRPVEIVIPDDRLAR